MKRLLALVLTVVLAFSLCVIPSSAVGESLTMTPNVTSLKAGDPISICISVGAVSQARGLQFSLILPTGVFENIKVSGTKTSTLAAALIATDTDEDDGNDQNANFSTNIDAGEVIYTANWDNAYNITAQTLLTITATVKSGATLGSATLAWGDRCVYSDASSNAVNFTTVNSSVSIYSYTASPIAVSITAPEKYQLPQANAAGGTGYTGSAITWKTGGTTLNGNFAPGTQYTATATLTADEGYQFIAGQTVAVAGLSSDKITYDAGNDATTLKFTATFPTTTAANLTSIVITPESPDSMTVPTGSDPATQQFNATGYDGASSYDILGSTAWSITSPESYSGISVSSTGLLSVSKSAAALFADSLEVTIQAASGSVTATKKVTLTRSASTVTEVVVSDGQASIDVPANGALANTTTTAFAANVKDQYGLTMTGQSITWSVKDGESDVTGVSIGSDGKVTVTNDAKTTITNTTGIALTVKALVGAVESDGTAKITVKRAAASVTTVAVSGGDSSIDVPKNGAAANTSAAFIASVTDQYGTAMTGQTITWSVKDGESGVTGVSIGSDGKVTVTNDAKTPITNTTGKALTVKAAVGTVVSDGTATITVKRLTPVYDKIEITRGASAALTSDLLVIPQSGSTAYTYTATVYDQYGSPITDSGTWSGTIGNYTGVTRADGVVTVAAGTTAQTSAGTLIYTDSNSHSATVTISLSTLAVNWSTVTVSSSGKTYGTGTTFVSFVTLPASGSAYDGVTTVNGIFSVVDAAELADVADTSVTVRFTVTSEGSYKGLTFDKSYTISVTARTLTVTPTSGQSKYFGASDPTLAYGSTGAVSSQTPGFTGALCRESGENAGTYNIKNDASSGALALADNGDFKAANYALSFTSGVKFTINPAEITITTLAPSHTVLANNAANTSPDALRAIANGGSTLPTEVAISYSGTTGTIGIEWANATQTFSAKGGAYTYVGTVDNSLGNFATSLPTLTATVTVTPVTVTDVKQDASTALPTGITVAKADVLAGTTTTLAQLGVPSKVCLTFDHDVSAMSDQTIVWNKTLADVKDVADTVDNTSDKKITLTVQTDTYPAWATAPASAKEFTITITNKFPVNVTFTTPIDDISYGETLASPVAAQVAIDHGTSGSASFTYSYSGTGSTTYGPSATKPTNVGTYQVTATLVSTTHSGTGTDAFTIEKKALAGDMITGITPGTNTYTGSAIEPVPTVADANGPITSADYTVSWSNNVYAGSNAKVVITAAPGGNYSGSAEFTFTIAKAELTGTPTVTGTAAVGSVLRVNHAYPESDVTYQWTRGGTPIAHATGKTYTLTSADSNQSIAVRVTGANVNYLNTSTITSASVTVAKQAVSGTVVITGGGSSVTNGDTLAAVITGMVPPEAQTDASYQWTATSAGATVNLGTASSQALADLAADTVVTVTVTPNANFSGTLSASVTVGKTPLAATLAIAGTGFTTGDIITPTGKVNGEDLISSNADYTLQWMRNGADIAGATGTTYAVTSADLGTSITLKAIGTGSYTGTVKADGEVTVAALAPSAPVITASAGNKQVTVKWSAPAANGSPITGYMISVKEGGTGSYDPGTLLGADAVSYTFSGLTNGTIYTFKLTAANAIGVSDSNEATATPYASSPGGGISAPGNTVKVTIPGTGATVSITIEVAGAQAEITSDKTAFGKLFENSSAAGTVVLDLSSLGSSVNEVVFPNSFVKALENALSGGESDITGLKIMLPGGDSILFDSDALKTICAAAGSGSLSVRIKQVAVGSLSSAMRGALNGENAGAVIEITVSTGGKEISDLGGTAKITFSVTIGSDVKSAKVYKLFSDGTRELVDFVLDLENGEITMERETLSTYAVIFSSKTEWVNPFADVSEKDWYYNDVAYVCGNSLMNGVSATSFSPSGTTTRAMVATVLWRLQGEPSASAANPFADVGSGMWYSQAIAWAAEKGIVNGIGGGLFDPTANVTREQFAAMLYRYAQYKGYDISAASSANITAFADHGEISAYALPAMTWAYGEGIITGRTGTALAPLGSAQRSELAAMLHRFLENSVK